MTRHALPIGLVSLTILAAAGFVAWGDWVAARVNSEVFKVLAELVVVVGLGGVGSLVFEGANRSRELRQQRRDRHRIALVEMIACYNEVKSLRRRLRAEAVRPSASDPAAVVSRDEYSALLRQLSDAQLKVEANKRLIDENMNLYDESATLVAGLKQAEQYLGELVTEWEEHLGGFPGHPPEEPLSSLPLLRCFLGDAKMGFRPGFADPISDVFTRLGRAIAK